MNLSAKTEYACIAVLELALHYESDRPRRIREIADANGVPSRFLVQILLQLKAAGIVDSVRGAAGGYRLTRDPAALTLAEVMAACETQFGSAGSGAGRRTPTTAALHRAWQRCDEARNRVLESITFADLAAEAARAAGSDQMYYI